MGPKPEGAGSAVMPVTGRQETTGEQCTPYTIERWRLLRHRVDATIGR
jgi:hypothetical protein